MHMMDEVCRPEYGVVHFFLCSHTQSEKLWAVVVVLEAVVFMIVVAVDVVSQQLRPYTHTHKTTQN